MQHEFYSIFRMRMHDSAMSNADGYAIPDLPGSSDHTEYDTGRNQPLWGILFPRPGAIRNDSCSDNSSPGSDTNGNARYGYVYEKQKPVTGNQNHGSLS